MSRKKNGASKKNKLEGSLNLDDLPRSMCCLCLDTNMFRGSVSLTRLPEALKWLNLQNNMLSGRVDLTCLPAALSKLHLNQNEFSGETDFSQLPKGLQLLNVSYTSLSGRIVAQNRTRIFEIHNSNVELVEWYKTRTPEFNRRVNISSMITFSLPKKFLPSL